MTVEVSRVPDRIKTPNATRGLLGRNLIFSPWVSLLRATGQRSRISPHQLCRGFLAREPACVVMAAVMTSSVQFNDPLLGVRLGSRRRGPFANSCSFALHFVERALAVRAATAWTICQFVLFRSAFRRTSTGSPSGYHPGKGGFSCRTLRVCILSVSTIGAQVQLVYCLSNGPKLDLFIACPRAHE